MTAHRFTSGTELGLPEGVCLRCATLQTPPGSSVCERPKPPVLLWRDFNNFSRLLVDGHSVANASCYNNGSWRWETGSYLLLLGMLSSCRGEFKTNLDDCKRDCEAFVLQHLDIAALERLRERLGAS